MLVRVKDLDSQLKVIWASLANGEGTGTLTASASAITWKAPGDSEAGTSVTIADGARVKVYAKDSTTKFLWVERDGSASLSCTALVTLDGALDPHEELSEVQTAIRATMKALSAGMGDERIQRESLQNLQHREQYLKAAIARVDGASARCATFDFSGMAG